MDGGAWWATVHGVIKRRTRDFTSLHFLWPIILLCRVLSPYLVYLRNLPRVREPLSAEMDSGEVAYG